MFPAGGKSDIEGIFPPPYFEWFQFNKVFLLFQFFFFPFLQHTTLQFCGINAIISHFLPGVYRIHKLGRMHSLLVWIHHHQRPFWWFAWILSGIPSLLFFLFLHWKCTRGIKDNATLFKSTLQTIHILACLLHLKWLIGCFIQGATLSALLLGYQAQVSCPSLSLLV